MVMTCSASGQTNDPAPAHKIGGIIENLDEDIYQDYLGALEYGNIFSLDVGPDYAGKIRKIDVKTLKKVGKYIRKSSSL